VQARIAPLEPPFPEDVARTLSRLMGGSEHEPLRLFRVLANHPQLLERFRSTGTYLLNFGAVDARDRELVIARTCARCGSAYEWGVHVAIYSSAVGLSEDEVAATVSGDLTALGERDRLLLALVDKLHDRATVGKDLWRELVAHWSDPELIELIVLVGQYHLVSFLTNALAIEREPWAAPLPVAATQSADSISSPVASTVRPSTS
jgi:alkylhydroperoxidase family enzyme